MTTGTDAEDDLLAAATQWLRDFAAALESGQPESVLDLLEPDAYWRDVLALTWDLRTFFGADQIRALLQAALPSGPARNLVIDAAHRTLTRAGRTVIEVVYGFTASAGSCRGAASLVTDPADGRLRAWTVMTELDRLGPPPEVPGPAAQAPARPEIRDFGAPTWRDVRLAQARYDDRDPAVLIVGAGQAGLALAARLRRANVDTLIVDREHRVGDNWRLRYHALVLHNEIWANHLPYMPFPETWPTYIPKDMLADWFEAYAAFMELNVWTSTEFVRAAWDPARRVWSVLLRSADGRERQLHPRHIVMAAGVSSIPYVPELVGLPDFAGEVLHASQFQDGESYRDRRVIVIGTGTSGHDIAQELACKGAQVTIVQRSPTTVVSVGPDHAGKVYRLYHEGRSTEASDLLNIAVPYPVLRHGYQLLTRELAEQDRALLDGLRKTGFRLDFGTDNTGFQMKYLRTGGGYYLNVGCSQLIVDGRVELTQLSDITRFTATGALLRNGSVKPADAVVLATGYLGQHEVVRRLFGSEIADRVGPIWGYDASGELRNMWRRTPQPGLWFTAGSLAQCRIFSKYLATQLLACETGLISADEPVGLPSGAVRPADLTDLWDGQLPLPSQQEPQVTH